MNKTIGNKQSDQILVKKVLNGDTNSFSEIIKNTERLVAQIVFKMIPNKEERKDIAQDVYIRIYKNLNGFQFKSKLSTWIGSIAYNTCINYLNKKKLTLLDIKNESEDDEVEIQINKNNSLSVETEKLIINNELSQILKTEIEKLTPIYKTLITLYHNEEMSYAEISQITELPEGTVKNYLFRARKKLRDNILLTYNKEAL